MIFSSLEYFVIFKFQEVKEGMRERRKGGKEGEKRKEKKGRRKERRKVKKEGGMSHLRLVWIT